MVILSKLFSLLSKKLGDIRRALFGWSITSLFKKLPKKQQLALTAALDLSLLWPLFVLGTIFPAAAAWAIAFVPLQKLLSPVALGVLWATLAVVSTAIVGLVTQWVIPLTNRKGGVFRTVLTAYPLALGYAPSFLTTIVTFPIANIASFFGGWSDEHVYAEPSDSKYTDAQSKLATACAYAGFVPSVENVAMTISLSKKAIKSFGHGVIAADRPRRHANA